MKGATSLGRAVRPLARKLPLLIAALLCAVLGTFAWLVNRELRGAFERAAADRLGAAAQRVSIMLAESAGALRGDIRRVAGDSLIVRLATSVNPLRNSATLAILGGQRTSSQRAARALWSADCRLIATTATPSQQKYIDTCPVTSRRSGSWVQPIFSTGDTAMYVVIAPVIRGGRDTVGYVEQLRVLANRQTADFISGLIGKDASVIVGNSTGPVAWTDLGRPVSGPPATISSSSAASHYTNSAGINQLGVALSVASTPWIVLAQTPMSAVMSAPYSSLRTLAWLGLACLLIGVLGAWALGNHVTRPLLSITRAAEDLAAGDYSARIIVSRDDELGQLMKSFNVMAQQVQAANQQTSEQAHELEHHVHEAQELAQQLEITNQELIEAAEQAESAVMDKELAQAILANVLVQAPVGIAVFDNEMRCVRLNPALAAMNGVPMEEHLGRTPNAVAKALGTVNEMCLQRVMRTGETVENERSNGVGASGGKRYWLASYFPVRGRKGEIRGAATIVLDTTAHHDLEAQLLQAQKMEAVGRLAGGVAHDFNNLLTVISSYSQMALETLSRDDPLYADMSEIRSSADRASRLTRQLLAFSRKQVMQPQTLDLNVVASEMENMLHRLIGEDVVLVMELADDLGDVRADPGQIEQVLMNLVVNSRDAMPDGGRLVISTSNESYASDQLLDGVSIPRGDYVTLSVSDTGVGMSDEIRAHLFEPFFTTKETGQGTGLGLSTVFGIVKQSGGDMAVESAPDAGSTFRMFLPRQKATREAALRNSGGRLAAHGGTETILLVEDDISLRSLTRRVLTAAGYSVLEARTANAAIEFGQNYRGSIDMLLTDVVMPQQNGRAVAARLNEMRPGLKILFMSGYTDDDVIRRGVIHAQSEFLQKPFTPDELTRRIREVLDKREVRVVA